MRADSKPYNFSKTPILVIGDLIFDAHHVMDYGGISGETGSALGIYKETRMTWGGAGLLVRNILALGGKVTFVSLLGDDEYALKADAFKDKNLRKVFFKESGRQTIVKERFLIGGKKVLRVNRGQSTFISKKTLAAIITFLKTNIRSFGKIVISDYHHGLIPRSIAGAIIKEAKEAGVPVYVDSQTTRNKSNHHWYRGADLVCLNQKEARSVYPTLDESKLHESLAKLRSVLEVKNVIVKLGEKGSASLLGKKFFATPAVKVNATDPVGAGDAFFAALAVSSNLDEQTVSLANAWAGFSTTIPGTDPARLSDFNKFYRK